ncbi:TPA: hypothetical protein ACH7QP_005464, partial [Escherichia coli]
HYNVENTGVTGSYPNLRINVALQRDNQCSQHCGECTGWCAVTTVVRALRGLLQPCVGVQHRPSQFDSLA